MYRRASHLPYLGTASRLTGHIDMKISRRKSLPPRNSVTLALVHKRISVGTGRHERSAGGQRRRDRMALQREATGVGDKK